MKIMSAKCSNTNIGMKTIQFRESFPDTTFHFIWGQRLKKQSIPGSYQLSDINSYYVILQY